MRKGLETVPFTRNTVYLDCMKNLTLAIDEDFADALVSFGLTEDDDQRDGARVLRPTCGSASL